jgi:16S rRNA (adenine1518-N6/adenine1519-N6)-dimethyltransferase
MLQKEMAMRLAASPADSAYGALSIRMQHDYDVSVVRSVPRTVFIPQPDVDSAVVRLRSKPATAKRALDRQLFERLVRDGFSQRRKQLRKLLDLDGLDWLSVASELQIEPTARAEKLSLATWIALADRIAAQRPSGDVGSPNELLAVVNTGDEVTGSAPRGTVHANNLRHRAVHILIFNSAGEVLLQKRSRLKDRHPLQWDSSAAGHVAARDSYETTAARELQEELGVATPLEQFAKIGASAATGEEFIQLYTGRHDGPFSTNAREIELVSFFPSDVVTQWVAARPDDFAPGFVECWRLYCRRVT